MFTLASVGNVELRASEDDVSISTTVTLENPASVDVPAHGVEVVAFTDHDDTTVAFARGCHEIGEEGCAVTDGGRETAADACGISCDSERYVVPLGGRLEYAVTLRPRSDSQRAVESRVVEEATDDGVAALMGAEAVICNTNHVATDLGLRGLRLTDG